MPDRHQEPFGFEPSAGVDNNVVGAAGVFVDDETIDLAEVFA